MKKCILAAVPGLAALALTVAGCGGGEETRTPWSEVGVEDVAETGTIEQLALSESPPEETAARLIAEYIGDKYNDEQLWVDPCFSSPNETAKLRGELGTTLCAGVRG